MSDRKEGAIQTAFREGQQAWRDGKSMNENPFPPEAVDYHDAWLQGWQAEANFNGGEGAHVVCEGGKLHTASKRATSTRRDADRG